MKHKIAFVMLLSVILLLGYYSVDIAEFFTNTSNLEQTKIPRDTSASGAIYISSGEDINFDPMSILEISDQHENYAVIDDWRIDYYPAGVVCENMLIYMSKYCNETEFQKPVSQPISDELKLSLNEYFYLDKYEYYNTKGELRYLDCIISLYEYRIIYLRYYSPHEATPESAVIETALNDFSRYSTAFYDPEKIWWWIPGDIYDKINSAISDYYLDMVAIDWSYPNESVNEYLESRFYIVSDIVSSELRTDSPLVEFWMKTKPFSMINFIDYDGIVKYVTGTVYVLDGISYYDYDVVVPSYYVYNGSIYQSVYLGTNKLITIYNIENGYVEGFYAEPVSSVW